eukprot:9066867-Pyramimonas_sp.AAC.1
MSAARVLVDDRGFPIDLLRTAPLDVKVPLRSGIQRWQARKMLPHLPQAGFERLWLRGVRIAVLKI